ncbi:amino acid ABC transporter permease [Intrasporangium chromatireducens Q5-1]|uniref:Amino acid ABC transporter permease n=1 Tax=Intrasporangium chromatireducens Q5-1 TaxID=584657 RepID=W9GQM6_9MICO|nr:amino acid ABC transporter permease [Intrasporangium chromatireducens]EWT07113.1 amino acid ABC transporter permease [Intrasporangium chromatireducens Q5-1]
MTVLQDWLGFLPQLASGLWVSVVVCLAAIVVGLPLGLALALGSSAGSRALRWPAIAVVEIGRGAPALVVLQVFYFGLPSAGLTLSSTMAACLALALTTAAYTSEIIRGGLQAVPRGELEATEALGMSRPDALRFVVIPQGIRVAIPPLMGFGVLIFQATSLAYTIALPELLGRAYSIGSSTFQYLSVLALAGLMYAAVTIPASLLTDRVERRMSRHLA